MKKTALHILILFLLASAGSLTASSYMGADGGIKLKGVNLKIHLARIYPTPRPGKRIRVFTRSSFRIKPLPGYRIKSGSLVYINGKSRIFKTRNIDKSGYFGTTAEAEFSGYHIQFSAIIQLKHLKSGKVHVIAKKFSIRPDGKPYVRNGKLIDVVAE